MSKFDNVLAEGAYEITLHGFHEEEYGTTDTTGWNAFTSVSAVTLLNVGATDLSARFREEHGESTLYAWIRENNEGFVTLVDHATNVMEIERAFDKYTAEMDKIAEEEESGSTWNF